MIYLTVTLAITQLLDWYSTRTILSKGGVERNEIMAALFAKFGMDRVLGAKTIGVTAIGWWIGTQQPLVLIALTVFYIGVVVYNWRSLP